MLQSLAHASIRVKNMEASKHFYGAILGLKHIRDEENERLLFSFFQIGDTQIELLQLKSGDYIERKDGPVDHIAFFVDDLKAEIGRLKELGVPFLMEEIREALEFIIIFIQGPDGERIELMERVK